jgi:hypothetical protein
MPDAYLFETVPEELRIESGEENTKKNKISHSS